MKRILFVDDHCEDYREDFNAIFPTSEFEITFCPTKDDGIIEIESGKEYDLILLDWYLETTDSSVLSQDVLTKLRSLYYVPVLIWTGHLSNFQETHVNYPSTLVEGISKDEFRPETLTSKINRWLSVSNAAKISNIYRKAIRIGLEEVFFDITELQENDILTVLKHVAGSEKNIDWSNDFVLNLIHRKLMQNVNFLERVTALMNSDSQQSETQSSDEKNKILNKILYFNSGSDSVRCGDIVEISIDQSKLYGIIYNPDCDLFTPKTRYVELIKLREYPDENLAINSSEKGEIKKNNHDSYYLFPAIKTNDEFRNLIAIFKSKIILETKLEVQGKYPLANKRIEFTDDFIVNGKDASMRLICSFVNPYKGDFLQRLHAHNSRIGTPNVKSLYQL